jgi:hypothetical protein
VHLHACITDGVFFRTATGEQAEPSVTFLPTRPIAPGDLDTLTQRVRKRLIRWFVGETVDPPPVSPARGPPTEWGELVQAHDHRDVVQASPDELPVIDIHSL